MSVFLSLRSPVCNRPWIQSHLHEGLGHDIWKLRQLFHSLRHDLWMLGVQIRGFNGFNWGPNCFY